MMMGETWADMLDGLPTLAEGWSADLKLETGLGGVGDVRVWLARTSLEDGEPFRRTVYVESWQYDESLGRYAWRPAWAPVDGEADPLDPVEGYWGTVADAYNATGVAAGRWRVVRG